MKRLQKLGFLILLLVMIVLTGCGNSEKGNEPASGNANEKLKITVGTDTSYVPFEFLDEKTGEYAGFDIDLLDAVAKEAGIEYELKPMDFNGIIPALQTKNLDMAIAGITIKDERKEIIDFSRPYYDAGTLILVQEGNNDIKGIDDLKGKTVATKQGTASYEYASQIQGLKNLVPFPNIDQAYMELEKGSADAVIFDSPNVLYYIKTKGEGKVETAGDLLQGQQFAIAFPKGSELREKIDVALNTVMENGIYAELYKKWFGEEPKSMPK
ncbi:glutamine ABC transporter substrate-binding protein GlnH [Bacillus sp. DTU_2020_1000418_1_SI_GHA_SEK_038]|uniref:glutamine ABC transporter substrate-binding protein GlnH n=1 Tax=Bacillus sp. DTU_2020_1000418_1_SI_GHA_SEK_038 TaxID=3077585 RepID=UPI0028EA82FE|nr:glutamine ABC transporter substrate-binding protein GlnH [Bacillus sp. DTU_2020_1000418_1_SI_GHA_SEK_038]WNS73713.1 glutamine ABC transporter substrate-binding protein GlnH [Bacillus sp. DTU_2020_1000418_1_SI_GHA_SEK_038]